MLFRPKVLLSLSGTVVSLILLMVGSKQGPTVLQDFPPWIAPAIKLCEAINAPATLLVGTMALLAHSIHVEQSFSRTPIPQMLFWSGVALLWFFAGLEIDLRRSKTLSLRHRIVAATAAITIVVALVSFGIAAWRQDEVIFSIGCAAWSAVLTIFYGGDLTGLAVRVSKRAEQ